MLYRKRQLGTVSYPYDDNDVKEERRRIAEMSLAYSHRYSIFGDQIEERISKRSRRLNTISFALDRYMSMGVFGANHCGKTKFIKQLVGSRAVRFGELYINNFDVKHQPHLAYRSVGFSAQQDAYKIFTPRQIFTYLFMLKGIACGIFLEKLHELSSSLDLRRYMCTRMHRLPADVRRRVCIGMCLIAFNKVVILDEPTAGMPAKIRRIIWNFLRFARFSGKTVVFSTHESIECDTLADYIIVVDKGEMLAIGSPQYLRQKYTRGFYLYVKVFCDMNSGDDYMAMYVLIMIIIPKYKSLFDFLDLIVMPKI